MINVCTDHVAAVSETRSDVTSEVYVICIYLYGVQHKIASGS